MDTQSSERQAGTTPCVESQPRVGFHADQIVERGRHATRTGGIGTQTETGQPQRNRHRRAGTGTAGNVVRVIGIAACAIR